MSNKPRLFKITSQFPQEESFRRIRSFFSQQPTVSVLILKQKKTQGASVEVGDYFSFALRDLGGERRM